MFSLVKLQIVYTLNISLCITFITEQQERSVVNEAYYSVSSDVRPSGESDHVYSTIAERAKTTEMRHIQGNIVLISKNSNRIDALHTVYFEHVHTSIGTLQSWFEISL